ncbi:hypothetical protein [Lujinxingia litoralis]|uniref:hypothetical protein n=1 Tax=Lujinxingia litoralis TaxID=2211119 RepID=UPI0013147231|nr:hypothetical protein [Lujinxingia litoralis]
MRATPWVMLATALVMLTGCQETVTVASNGAAMMVASALLWSTVRLSKHAPKDED